MRAMTYRRAILALAATALLVACGDQSHSTPAGAQPVEPMMIRPIIPAVATTELDADAAGPSGFVAGADGVIRPAPELTPGAIYADVDATDICALHYTQGIRQPRYNAKVMAFSGYSVSIHERDVYKVDHLIPVSLGGSNEIENLWPQPYDDVAGAAQKDLLERQLRGLVCSHTLDLGTAQRVIAADWWDAYETYMGLPVEPGSEGPLPWQPPDPESGAVINGGRCEEEGAVGHTDPKKIELTCKPTGMGELRWQKRS